MRAACRKFLDSVEGPHHPRLHGPRGFFEPWGLGPALGELRGVAGVCVAGICERYGLDVEAPLSTILPAEPKDDD